MGHKENGETRVRDEARTKLAVGKVLERNDIREIGRLPVRVGYVDRERVLRHASEDNDLCHGRAAYGKSLRLSPCWYVAVSVVGKAKLLSFQTSRGRIPNLKSALMDYMCR